MPVAMQSRFVATLFYSLPYCLKAKSQPGARMATSKSQQFSFVCLGCLCVTCAQHMLALMEPVSSFSLSFVSALIFLLCVYVCELRTDACRDQKRASDPVVTSGFKLPSGGAGPRTWILCKSNYLN